MSLHVLRRHLSMPGLLSSVRKAFVSIPDPFRYRQYSLPDCLMAGLAIFALKYPSLLQFDTQTRSEEADPVVATGKVTGNLVERHRSREFLTFLDQLARDIKPGSPVHVVLDNVSSHKSAEVHQCLKDKENWMFHFTPTSASWMNAVEGFFSKLARQRLKNAIFNSLDECIEAIEYFIEHHNENNAQPFKWSKEPEDIVASWKRGYQKPYPKLDTSV